MSFIWPIMLVLLLLIPLFVWLYLRMQHRRQQIVASYGRFVQGGRAQGMRRHIPPILFLVSLIILIVALARPVTVVSVPRIEGTVILGFDVSGSMAADDLKPTRLDAAKAAAKDFVEKQPITVQIGVVAFTDSGFAAQPPTNDQGTVLAAIDRLSPQRGTSLGHGIDAALNTIDSVNKPAPLTYSNLTQTPTPTPTPVPKGTFTSAAIVLLTDGENNEQPNPIAEAQMAADRGIRIYTIGIGTAQGTNLKINGFTLHTALDEATLQQIAQITSGTYYNAQNEQDLHTIYDNLSPQLIVKPEKLEVTSIFAGVSILVLVIGGLFSMLWFGRMP